MLSPSAGSGQAPPKHLSGTSVRAAPLVLSLSKGPAREGTRLRGSCLRRNDRQEGEQERHTQMSREGGSMKASARASARSGEAMPRLRSLVLLSRRMRPVEETS